uniref:DUF2188 domain-containing protein n=1 Tax=Angiostrongylus cantonensis TaxID=6313 RepID=A0A158P6Z1_ANGCA
MRKRQTNCDNLGRHGRLERRRMADLVRHGDQIRRPQCTVSHVGDVECDEATRRRRRKQGVVAIVDDDFASDCSHHQRPKTLVLSIDGNAVNRTQEEIRAVTGRLPCPTLATSIDLIYRAGSESRLFDKRETGSKSRQRPVPFDR